MAKCVGSLIAREEGNLREIPRRFCYFWGTRATTIIIETLDCRRASFTLESVGDAKDVASRVDNSIIMTPFVDPSTNSINFFILRSCLLSFEEVGLGAFDLGL